MPIISIILSAYNAEYTVSRMIDSILDQTFTDWELLAINDGSTDNTGKILDGYAASDNRIKVHHKINAGIAAARQDGIDMAKGEFTIHADADDWIEPRMLEEMLEVAMSDHADIVVSDYFTDLDGKTTIIKQSPRSLSSEDILYGLYAKEMFGGLWNKLVKKSTYDNASAHFYSGINHCADFCGLSKIKFH